MTDRRDRIVDAVWRLGGVASNTDIARDQRDALDRVTRTMERLVRRGQLHHRCPPRTDGSYPHLYCLTPPIWSDAELLRAVERSQPFSTGGIA